MKSTFLSTRLLSTLLIFSIVPAHAFAQEPDPPQEPAPEVRLRDLTDGPLRSEELIEVLKPKVERPPGLGLARGARGLAPPKTDCGHLREQQSRGITVKPVADVAAVEILFHFDSDQLTADAREALHEIAETLQAPSLSDCCFRFDGHADALGDDEYNRELSRRRAERVRRYLVDELGVDQGRIMVDAHGENRPIADNSTEDGRRKNRRVEIVNLGYGRSSG